MLDHPGQNYAGSKSEEARRLVSSFRPNLMLKTQVFGRPHQVYRKEPSPADTLILSPPIPPDLQAASLLRWTLCAHPPRSPSLQSSTGSAGTVQSPRTSLHVRRGPSASDQWNKVRLALPVKPVVTIRPPIKPDAKPAKRGKSITSREPERAHSPLLPFTQDRGHRAQYENLLANFFLRAKVTPSQYTHTRCSVFPGKRIPPPPTPQLRTPTPPHRPSLTLVLSIQRSGWYWSGSPSCFSRFPPLFLVVDGVSWSCAEQYMIAEKVRRFQNHGPAGGILSLPDPRGNKHIG